MSEFETDNSGEYTSDNSCYSEKNKTNPPLKISIYQF